MGLSAINQYVGLKDGENTLKDYIEYVRNDLMGITREDVVASIACPTSGSKFEVTLAGKKWTVEAPDTGSYERFKTVTLGTVEVSRKGPCELSIKPVRGQWQAMNIGPVVLKPTD